MTFHSKSDTFPTLKKMNTDKLKILEENISTACADSGRSRSEVTLIAVSKTRPMEDILKVHEAGQIHFGENKARELQSKAEYEHSSIIWHFIGHLQSNKVKYIIDSAEYIHSVETEKLSDEINKRSLAAGKIQKIFIEVNTSGEESKFGLREYSKIEELAGYCGALENIEVCGLMTMAPYTDDEKILRNCFSGLRKIRDDLSANFPKLRHLSMGMSNDYPFAIQEGATMVRVGTAVFGERN